jgi:hypothetical protein
MIKATLYAAGAALAYAAFAVFNAGAPFWPLKMHPLDLAAEAAIVAAVVVALTYRSIRRRRQAPIPVSPKEPGPPTQS